MATVGRSTSSMCSIFLGKRGGRGGVGTKRLRRARGLVREKFLEKKETKRLKLNHKLKKILNFSSDQTNPLLFGLVPFALEMNQLGR